MTELTVLLNPPSTDVTSTLSDIQPVALTMSVVNNQATDADVSGGLMVEFTADPGISTAAGMNGPVDALLASNFTANPYLANADGTLPPVTLLPPTVTAANTAGTQWGIDSGSLVGATLVFTAQPDDATQYTIPPGGNITFAFSGVSVDTVPGVSTVTVSVLPSTLPGGTAATISAQPQIQKMPVPLLNPVVTADPPVLNPPSSETKLSWSNNGATSCKLEWDDSSAIVTYNGAAVTSSWNPPLVVSADTNPATATLLETTVFTLHAYGTGSGGNSPELTTSVTVTVNQPEFSAITVPPLVSGIMPPSGDPAGGQTVTITGTRLTQAAAVTFTPAGASDLSATGVAAVSDTAVTAITPKATPTSAAPVLADITVITPVGASPATPASIYTYLSATSAVMPVVTGVSPGYGAADGGDQVTITGSGLAQATSVTFTPAGAASGRAAIPAVVSDSELTVTTPGGSGIVDITVSAGPAASPITPASQYTYVPAGSPIVTGVMLTDSAVPGGGSPPTRTPDGGDQAGGQPVIITGTGLTSASSVTFTPLGSAAGIGASATDVTNVPGFEDTQITATTPAGTGIVDVIVTAASGTSPATPVGQFSYGIPAVIVPPYQPFDLIWSCYQNWNPILSWSSSGQPADGPNVPEVIVTPAAGTVIRADGSVSGSGRATATINCPATFTITVDGRPAPADLPVNIAPVDCTHFAYTQACNPDTGQQTVTLTWEAANVVGFLLTQNGVALPDQPSPDDRTCTVQLPLVTQPEAMTFNFKLIAYGYDTSHSKTQIPQSVPVKPLPAELNSPSLSGLRVTDSAGTQTVTLSFQAKNATGITIAGPDPRVSVTLPPTATGLDLNLPAPVLPGPLKYSIQVTANGYTASGYSYSATYTVSPLAVQLLYFTATPAGIHESGDEVTLSWDAEYPMGFTMSGLSNDLDASTRNVSVTPWRSTQYTLTAKGYPPGSAFPSLSLWISVDPIKVIEKAYKEDNPRSELASRPNAENDPDLAGPTESESQPGQQAFISPDERPDASAHLPGSGQAQPPEPSAPA